MSLESSPRKVVGRVVSDKAEKTIVVLTENRKPHSIYGKYQTLTKKLHAHVEAGNKVKCGDLVMIEECAPYSKKKNWILKEVIKQAQE